MHFVSKKIDLSGYSDILKSEFSANSCDIKAQVKSAVITLSTETVSNDKCRALNNRMHTNTSNMIICPEEINIYEYHTTYDVSDRTFLCRINLFYLYNGKTECLSLVIGDSSFSQSSDSRACIYVSKSVISNVAYIDFFVKPKVALIDIVAIEHDDLTT